jgi:hypothetical protein
MSDNDLPPPGSAIPVGMQSINIPVVWLNNTTLRMDKMPNGVRALMIGPLVLALPLSAENEQWFRDNLAVSGIVLPKGPLPPVPPH